MRGLIGILGLNSQLDIKKRWGEWLKEHNNDPDAYRVQINKNVLIGFYHNQNKKHCHLKNHFFFNEDRAIMVSIDGRIFNKMQLSKELEGAGHSGNLNSEASVIFSAYERWGIDCLEKLDGVFSFAIWDGQKKRLFIARDRVGVKPLFYYHRNNELSFGTKIRNLLMLGNIQAVLNEHAVHEYLAFRTISGENTLFRHIKKLLPGHYILVERNKVRIEKYWDINLNDVDFKDSERKWIDEIRSRLSHALEPGLTSNSKNVPGLLLSGGVDSGYITALASQIYDGNLLSFSVGFEEKDYDETHLAQMVSEKHSTRHHVLYIKSDKYADEIPRVINKFEFPLNHPSTIPMFLLYEYASNYCDKLLTGEGADSLFAGSPIFALLKLVSKNNWTKKFIRIVLNLPPQLFLPKRIKTKKKRLNTILDKALTDMLLFGQAYCNLDDAKSLVSFSLPKTAFSFRQDICNKISVDILKRYLYLIIKMLPESFNFMEKLGEEAGVQIEFPFLDYKFVEFANRIPLNLKFRRMTGKYILKKAAADYLPKEHIYKRKSGFGVPLEKWFMQTDSMGKYIDMLLEPRTLQRNIFNKSYLVKMVNDYKGNVKASDEFEGLLWTSVNLELWCRIFIDRDSSLLDSYPHT